MNRQKEATALIVEVGEWATIHELRAKFRSAGFFKAAELEKASLHYIDSKIRHYVQHVKNDDGSPVYVSIEKESEEGTGTGQRVYKQLTLCNLDDFRKAIRYRGKRMRHEQKLLRMLKSKAREKFGEQLEFDY